MISLIPIYSRHNIINLIGIILIYLEIYISHNAAANNEVQDNENNNNLQIFTLLSSNGIREDFANAVPDLRAGFGLVREKQNEIKWFCASNGSLWIEYNDINFRNRKSLPSSPLSSTSSSSELYYLTYGSKNSIASSCRKVRSDDHIPASIRHVGNTKLNRIGLSLYSDENFNGQELYFEGDKLIYNFNFKSYGFTGSNNWLIYSEGNFRGDSSCLVKRSNNKITINEKFEFGLGSLHLGCPYHSSSNSGNDNNNNNSPSVSSFALILYYEHPWRTISSELQTTELYFDGIELRLPFSRSFHSYSILDSTNGSYSNYNEIKWTIFSGVHFNGDSKCLSLLSQENLENNYNNRNKSNDRNKPIEFNGLKKKNNRHAYHDEVDNIHLMIGSIRFGCFEQDPVDYGINFLQLRNHNDGYLLLPKYNIIIVAINLFVYLFLRW